MHVYSYAFLCYFVKQSESLKVGDVISIEKDKYVPADILLLSAETEKVFVDTATINGEMSLI